MKKRTAFIGLVLFFSVGGNCLRGSIQAKTLLSAHQLQQLKKIDNDKLRQIATDIAEYRPEVIFQLPKDATMIMEQRKEVSNLWASYEFDSDSQKKAEAYIWRDLRLNTLKADDKLKPETWRLAAGARRGRLAVFSNPEHAEIYLDNGNQPVSLSNDYIFPPAGPHQICLRLTGYDSYCENRSIKSGLDNTDIDAKLNPSLPAAPSNLSTAAVSSSQINLSWTDNSNNETGFKIERCLGRSCTDYAEVATVGANVRVFSNTGLSSNQRYSYRLRAFNANGTSDYSNIAGVRTQQPKAN